MSDTPLPRPPDRPRAAASRGARRPESSPGRGAPPGAAPGSARADPAAGDGDVPAAGTRAGDAAASRTGATEHPPPDLRIRPPGRSAASPSGGKPELGGPDVPPRPDFSPPAAAPNPARPVPPGGLPRLPRPVPARAHLGDRDRRPLADAGLSPAPPPAPASSAYRPRPTGPISAPRGEPRISAPRSGDQILLGFDLLDWGDPSRPAGPAAHPRLPGPGLRSPQRTFPAPTRPRAPARGPRRGGRPRQPAERPLRPPAPPGVATPPIPEPSGETICALCASLLEVLGGARPVEQLARWIAEPVFNRLRIRVTLAARGRQLRGTEIPVPAYRFGPVHRCSPAPGVVEAAVVVRDRVRARAIAIRFEGTQARWLATAIHVL